MAGWLFIFILAILTLLPAITFFHQDELGRWTLNRCAMAAPDEHSYLLMAQNLAAGKGPSIRALAGSETFYPPGFPLLLAGWIILINATGGLGLPGGGGGIQSMHLAVTLQLCATVPLVFLVVRQMIRQGSGLVMQSLPRQVMQGPRGAGSSEPISPLTHDLVALIITALYATNWYVLETGLFVFSEPAFTFATLFWLYIGLRHPHWYDSWRLSLLMGLLATVALSIRGAGIVVAAATVLYPLTSYLRQLLVWYKFRPGFRLAGELTPVDTTTAWRRVLCRRVIAWLLILLVLGTYILAAQHYLPKSPDSYMSQLTRGLTDGGAFPEQLRTAGPSPQLFTNWAYHIGRLAVSHLQDWTANFAPPYRESEDTFLSFDRPALHQTIATILLGLAILGWLGHLFTPSRYSHQLGAWFEQTPAFTSLP
ncbi:MAG: hypothetical protein WCI73_11575, partial [Phycisphaerae bacterium]